MDQLLLFITVLVIFVYFGGSNVPKVLRDNKQIFLGVIVGLFLCNSMGLRLEGFANKQQCEDAGCEDCSTTWWNRNNPDQSDDPCALKDLCPSSGSGTPGGTCATLNPP